MSKLFWEHRNGQWAKKIKGRTVYFGKVADDPEAEKAAVRYHSLALGGAGKDATVGAVCEAFLRSKRALKEIGELSPLTLIDYERTARNVALAFGDGAQCSRLGPLDFERLRRWLAEGRGPTALGNEINRVRVLFRYAFEAGLVSEAIRFGPGFKRPSKRAVRAVRESKMIEAEELRAVLEAARGQMKAMILLGINCGWGNSDVGGLRWKNLDLTRGWANYPRPKTGVDRRVPLWRRTVVAIEESGVRDGETVFVTRAGNRWARNEKFDSPVTKEFRKLLEKTGVYRKGLGFYGLRHTFETIAGESCDQVAVNAIMGHVDSSMAGVYRERVGDGRLLKVVRVVEEWLYGDELAGGSGGGANGAGDDRAGSGAG